MESASIDIVERHLDNRIKKRAPHGVGRTEKGANVLTKNMQAAMDELTAKRDRALSAANFQVWYKGSEDAYKEWAHHRVKTLGEARVCKMIESAYERYTLAMGGIVQSGNINRNTIQALINRGYLEEVDGSYSEVKICN